MLAEASPVIVGNFAVGVALGVGQPEQLPFAGAHEF